MKECTIDIAKQMAEQQKKNLEGIVPQWISEFEAKTGIIVSSKEFNIYTPEQIQQIEEYFNYKVVEAYGEKYKDAVTLVHHSGVGFNMVKIEPDFNNLIYQHIINKLEKSDEPSVIEGSFSEHKNNKKLLAETYKKKYSKDHKGLYSYMLKVVDILQKLVKDEDFKTLMSEQTNEKNKSTLKGLRAQVKRLKTSIRSEEFKDSLLSFADYILLSANSLKIYREYLEDSLKSEDTKLGRLEKLHDIYNVASSYKEMFVDLNMELEVDSKNFKLNSIVSEALSDISKIESSYVDTGSDLISEIFFELQNHPVRARNLTRAKKELESVKKRLVKAEKDRDLKRVNFIKKELLPKAEKGVKDAMLNPSMIKDALLGKMGDMNYIRGIFMSASRSGDLVLSSFGNFYRSLMDKLVNQKGGLRELFSEFDIALNKYYKTSTKANKHQPEKDGKRFIEYRRTYFYDYNSKKVKSLDSYPFILHNIKPEFYEEREEILANIAMYDDLIQQEVNRDTLAADELARKTWYDRKNEFNDKYSLNKYTEAYYAPRNKLNEFKVEFKKDYDKAFANGELTSAISSFEEYDEITDKINILMNKVEFYHRYGALGDSTQTEIDELRDKRSRIFNTRILNTELDRALENADSSEYDKLERDYKFKVRAAEALKEYTREMRKREDFVLQHTFESGAEWDGEEMYERDMKFLRDMLSNSQVTYDEFIKFRDKISTKVFNKDFIIKQNEYKTQIRDIITQIMGKLGAPKNKEFDERMSVITDMLNPIRDHAGIPDASLLSNAQQELITDLEDEAFNAFNTRYDDYALQAVITYGTETGKAETFIELLYDRKEKLRWPDDKEEIQEINADIKDLKNKAYKVKGIFDLVQELKKLRSLKNKNEIRIKTDYYIESYEEEFNNYINTISQIPKDLSYFTVVLNEKQSEEKVEEYSKIGNAWYKLIEGNQVKLDKQEGIVDIWKSTQEESFKNHIYTDNEGNVQLGWYLRNHYQNNFGVYKPSRAWLTNVPADTVEGNIKDQLTYAPGFKYKRKVVKDSYINDAGEVISLKNPDRTVSKEHELLEDIAGFKLPTTSNLSNSRYNNLEIADKEILNFMLSQYKSFQDDYPQGAKKMGFRMPTNFKELNAASIDLSALSKSTPSTMIHLGLRDFYTTEQDVDEGELRSDGITKTSIRGVKELSLPHYYSSYVKQEEVNQLSTNVFLNVLKYGQAAKKNNIIRTEMQPVSKVAEELLRLNTPEEKGKTSYSWLKLVKSLENGLKKKLGHDKDIDEVLDGEGKVRKAQGDNTRLRLFNEYRSMWEHGQLVSTSANPTINLFGKEIRLDKIIGKIRTWKSFQILASLNPVKPFTLARETANIVNGVFQSVISTGIADGHIKFTGKQYAKALKDYTAKYMLDMGTDYWGAKVTNKSFFGTMMDRFNVVDGRVYNDTGQILVNKSKIQMAANGDFMFLAKNSAELMLYSSAFLAYMRSVPIKLNGKTLTLWDAYEKKKDNWDANIKNGVLIDSGKREDNGDIIYEPFTDFHEQRIRENIQALLDITQGNYGQINKTLVERTWWGAGLLWMMKFFVTFAFARYGNNSWDINNQDFDIGYYRRTFTVLSNKVQNWKSYQLTSGQYKLGIIPELGGDLSEKDKAAIRRSLLEYSMFLASGAIVFTLFGYDDNDEDRFKKMKKRAEDSPILGEAFNWALYSTIKANAEMETMLFPGGVTEIAKIGNSRFYSVLPIENTYKMIKDDIEWFGIIPTGLEKTKKKYYGFDKGEYKIKKRLFNMAASLDPVINTRKKRESSTEVLKGFEGARKR